MAPGEQPAAQGRSGGIFAQFKARVRAFGLVRQIRRLRSSLDGQLEQLGLLVLEHRPSGVDVDDLLPQIAAMQAELVEVRAAGQALGRTRSGVGVASNLKREEASLAARAREMLGTVGFRAAAAKPQMPNATGHYAAAEHLRDLLEAVQAELEHIQTRTARPSERPTWSALTRATLIGLGAVSILLAFCVVAFALWPRSGLGDYAFYLPDQVGWCGRIHLADVRENAAWERVPLNALLPFTNGLSIPDRDVRDVFMFASEDGSSAVVFRTEKGLALEDAVRDAVARPREAEGVSYVSYLAAFTSGARLIAQTDERTFCIAEDERQLKEVLGHLKQHRQPLLAEGLQEVLDEVSGHDLWAVADCTGRDAWSFPKADYVGAGVSFGEDVRGRALLILASENSARRWVEALREGLALSADERDVEYRYARPGRRAATTARKILRSVRIARQGRTVRVSVDCSADDFAESMSRGSPALLMLLREALGEAAQRVRRSRSSRPAARGRTAG